MHQSTLETLDNILVTPIVFYEKYLNLNSKYGVFSPHSR